MSESSATFCCAVCLKPCSLRCGRCGQRYCCRECQLLDWKLGHKEACKPSEQKQPEPTRAPSSGGVQSTIGRLSGGALPAPDAWLRGLSTADSYEWLTNCYQMRCDDDYAWGGGFLHGPYDPDATNISIALDFLVFCILARRNRVIPADWKWTAFFKVAANFVVFAFEKSDASERWGSENVFNVMSGGRSLRYTGEIVYKSAVTNGGELDEEHTRLLGTIGEFDSLEEVPKPLIDEVGGLNVWRTFAKAIGKMR